MDNTIESTPHEAFFYVELLCNLWFIVEFTTRFLVIMAYVQMFALYLVNGANKIHKHVQIIIYKSISI